MPICLLYGSAILITGALEMVATLFYTSNSQRPTDERFQRYVINFRFTSSNLIPYSSTSILGLTLPMFDTILLISFVLWTVSRKCIATRAYVFEVMLFCLTALWVTLTVLFNLEPAPLSEDLNGLLFVPILITLQMVDCALHAFFLLHFAFYLQFKDSDLGGRVML